MIQMSPMVRVVRVVPVGGEGSNLTVVPRVSVVAIVRAVRGATNVQVLEISAIVLNKTRDPEERNRNFGNPQPAQGPENLGDWRSLGGALEDWRGA